MEETFAKSAVGSQWILISFAALQQAGRQAHLARSLTSSWEQSNGENDGAVIEQELQHGPSIPFGVSISCSLTHNPNAFRLHLLLLNATYFLGLWMAHESNCNL